MEQEQIAAWAETAGKGIDDDQKAEDVKMLIDDMMHDTNAFDHNGLTPLHWVCSTHLVHYGRSLLVSWILPDTKHLDVT